MVSAAILLISMLPGRSLVYGSGFAKDSTTAWCASLPVGYNGKEVYRCYPNPWGSGNVHLYVRFPDSSGIKGCLRGYGANLMTVFVAGQWIFAGGGAPYLPRITLDQDEYCLQGSGIVNTATPGDSVEMEFWFTPRDTVVTDTIRGTFKAWYRGDMLPADWGPTQPRDPASSIRWTRSGLFVPRPLSGTVRMTDLCGRNCQLQARPSSDGTLLVPAHRPVPGVYRIAWPQGGVTVLVP